jgi:DNA-directed RNA polymerase
VVEALSQVATSATEVLGWLEKVGQLTAKAGIPIRWSTPVGFSVEQKVMDVNAQAVVVNLNGQKSQLKLAVKGTTLNKTKQKSGTAPNFVHSYDAAHACLTVNACKARGVDSFAMIHDSYGTHAADATELSAVLRDEFVGMYQDDALIGMYEGLRTQCDEETFALIPTPPIGGDLDLSCVYESEYFFS